MRNPLLFVLGFAMIVLGVYTWITTPAVWFIAALITGIGVIAVLLESGIA